MRQIDHRRPLLHPLPALRPRNRPGVHSNSSRALQPRPQGDEQPSPAGARLKECVSSQKIILSCSVSMAPWSIRAQRLLLLKTDLILVTTTSEFAIHSPTVHELMDYHSHLYGATAAKNSPFLQWGNHLILYTRGLGGWGECAGHLVLPIYFLKLHQCLYSRVCNGSRPVGTSESRQAFMNFQKLTGYNALIPHTIATSVAANVPRTSVRISPVTATLRTP